MSRGRRTAITLRITDADGEGGQVALTSPEPIISPAWSPDGRELAYVSFESQKAVVWMQDVSSGQRRTVANFRGSNSAPAWSPDGRHAGADAVARRRLAALPDGRDGGAPRRLTQSSADRYRSRRSRPTARSIYFVSDRGGGPQIYRMPAAGGNPSASPSTALQHQPGDQPRRQARWPTSRAGRRRLSAACAGPGQRNAPRP